MPNTLPMHVLQFAGTGNKTYDSFNDYFCHYMDLKGFSFIKELRNPQYFSSIITRNPSMLAPPLYWVHLLKRTCSDSGWDRFWKGACFKSHSQFQPVDWRVCSHRYLRPWWYPVCWHPFWPCKRAYTGAESSRSGLIERAAGGTIFLDEVGDLSKVSQVKLLRLLQEGIYYPLGSDTPRRCRARIITAANKELNKLAAMEGEFRMDLYYRLSTHLIMIPPLKGSAKRDIPFLLII